MTRSPMRAPRHVLLSLLLLLAAAGPGAQAGEQRAVVELFTSQGCSSCPPADKLMGELSRRGDLVALTYPVDYWDYLGWRDTLASPGHSARQRAYAEARGDRAVYTPQVVINGARHVVGSDREAIDRELERQAPLPVTVDLTRSGDLVEVRVDGALPADAKMATVYFVFISRPIEVEIDRGENVGRQITYHQVVRDIRAVGMWEGGPAVFRLPASEMRKAKAGQCAVLVQVEEAGRPGAILGAAIN
ncbi:thioredoxin family protein [Stappia sp. P2PMeth1]|uniref:DUF1223 domain-containing protein n=1 Tax=Stappia sp. P2PMeth1 TaxID=2003586 RepID=UPI001AD8A946|nr:DUF1223 domain-containing protein [Stappia sp. P2PMeth1]